MLIQFFKIRVVFHTLYLWNEVCDPKFWVISDTSNSLSDRSKNFKKIYQQEKFCPNVLKFKLMLLSCTKSNYTEAKMLKEKTKKSQSERKALLI